MGDVMAVIQAGGLGTRLAPYSTVLPKALMPLGDGTVVDSLLTQFCDAGVKRVFITVSKFGPLIRSYCGDGGRWGVDIEYVVENEPLGTIGPLNALRDRLHDAFFVANSDVYTDVRLDDVVAFNALRPAPLTVVAKRQTIDISYGVLEHEAGRATGFHEKPSQQYLVSTGIYLMAPSIFEHIPAEGAFGFDQLMRAMLADGTPVNVYEHMGSWIDIGRIDDLRRAQEQAAAPMTSRT
jgi:NDP-sugar pyrophosphorylase family protein